MAPTVLVIEDNPANMKLSAMLLERAGYTTLRAWNAQDGLALAREHVPHLVLMDIQLPGMDGLEATRILKADPLTRDIQVVALTAFAMKGEQERIREAGCDGYITKPIDYKRFLAEIAQWLSVGEGAEE
ncbi:MAG: response regulator [Burkholderiaceae bacterium]|nr:MAG: response regulator [Burkholderiaceae bacterium]